MFGNWMFVLPCRWGHVDKNLFLLVSILWFKKYSILLGNQRRAVVSLESAESQNNTHVNVAHLGMARSEPLQHRCDTCSLNICITIMFVTFGNLHFDNEDTRPSAACGKV